MPQFQGGAAPPSQHRHPLGIEVFVNGTLRCGAERTEQCQHKYLNSKGVPQLLLNTGASKWNDPKNFKWTMAGLPLYPTEARILAKHVVAGEPEGQNGIPYPKKDFCPEFLRPLQKGPGEVGGHT